MNSGPEMQEKTAEPIESTPSGSDRDVDVAEVESPEPVGWDKKATARLLRKLDWNIIPIMSLIYLLCFLDRTNIGNARLENLEEDLGLTGLQYNDCLAILFPFYIAAEIPSNLMMKRLRPSVWITIIMFAWSVCMVAQGYVSNYAGLMATRVFLGLSEGGLFPGVSFYITQYYRRDECGIRMATFFSAATLAGAFGGILARGIAEMDGVGGRPAWSWIFALEGLASVLVSVAAYWCIRDYPRHRPKFLTPAELDEVQRRLREDTGDFADQKVEMKYVLQALRDWKIWVHMFIFLGCFCPIYSYSLFAPTIVRGMGYTANSAQLMSVPPYVCACVVTVGTSYYADRLRQRGVFMLGFQLVALAGLAMLAGSRDTSVQYGGLVLAAVGLYTQVPLSMAWNSGNIGGSVKRAVGIAMQVMGGNTGGIIASYVYLSGDAPRYIKGHSILIGFIGMAFLLTLFMTTWCRLENKRRDKASGKEGAARREVTREQRLLEKEMADASPYFRYSA